MQVANGRDKILDSPLIIIFSQMKNIVNLASVIRMKFHLVCPIEDFPSHTQNQMSVYPAITDCRCTIPTVGNLTEEETRLFISLDTTNVIGYLKFNE